MVRDDAIAQEIKNLSQRDEPLRISPARGSCTSVLEALANLIPGVDVAADVAMLADVAGTVSEYSRLTIDATAALNFIKDGPQSFEDLQVSSSDYEQFSTYDEFVKVGLSAGSMAKRFGQRRRRKSIPSHRHARWRERGQNSARSNCKILIILSILPTILHEAVNDEYLRTLPNPNMNLYQWLQTQPYEVQREEGLEILRELQILK